MRIIVYECKKALTSPILITLLLLFAGFNIFIIMSNANNKEHLDIVNRLADQYGVEITDRSLELFQEDIQLDLAKLNEITEPNRDQEYSSIFEFLEALDVNSHRLYSEDEWTFFNQLQVKEMYLMVGDSIESDYEQINWSKIAEGEIAKYQLSGPPAQLLKEEYTKLSKRFERMKEEGEHKEWFFSGKQYLMHSFLFRTLFGHLVFESLILIVLTTALITNFEFESRTHLVAYSTRRGRKLKKDKLIASLLTTTVITSLLFIATLGVYFTVFDYSNLWQSSISSALNWEYQLPYVSWWELSFGSFLLLSTVLIYVCMLLFTMLTYSISMLVKNNYFTFFIFAAFFAIVYMIPSFTPASSLLILIFNFNLSALVMNPHLFFMGNSGLSMFKYYEILTVSVWTLITVLSCAGSYRVFKRQEIH